MGICWVSIGCPGDRIAGVLVAAGASRGDVESVLIVVGNVVPGSEGLVRYGVVVDLARRDGEREEGS